MGEPASPQTAPYGLEPRPGERRWCARGRSKNQPFCGGTHEKL
jgi:CDGSH-type Zn-finger protein